MSEYGVHWNFFFTLAGVSILTSIINIPAQYAGILGSLVLVGKFLFPFYLCFVIQNMTYTFIFVFKGMSSAYCVG